jgi:hypothetical protein
MLGRRGRHLTLLAALGLVTIVLASCASSGIPSPDVVTGDASAGTSKGGIFIVTCQFSHRAPNDPLVHAGMPGMSHSHDFFGNTTTNASSTPDSLINSPTTCDNTGDRSGYWVPTLSQNGVPMTPTKVQVYYEHNQFLFTGMAGRAVAFPKGFAMIAGSAKGVRTPDLYTGGGSSMNWYCLGKMDGASGWDAVPSCADGVTLRIDFPSCWDGVRLYAPDQSHVVYPTYDWTRNLRSCPADHPVVLPHLRYNIDYPGVTNGAGVTLASGGPGTSHADFMSGWDQQRLTDLVEQTNNGAYNLFFLN